MRGLGTGVVGIAFALFACGSEDAKNSDEPTNGGSSPGGSSQGGSQPGGSSGASGSGAGGMSGAAGTGGAPPDPLPGDTSGITAQPSCALAQNGQCITPITRTKDEVCARWASDRPKRAEVPYIQSTVACDPGVTTVEAQEDGVRRLNLVRWLSGLDPLTLNPEWSAYASACAVIQAYLVPDITHFPEPSATCYTTMGADGSSTSQIAGAPQEAADSVDSLLWDWGDNNLHILGHRIGMLYPGTREVGIGFSHPPDGATATCVRTLDGTGVLRSSGLAGTVAFPPWGRVPYELVSRSTYAFTSDQALEWSISAPDDVTLSGARLFRQTSAGYEPVSITSGALESPDLSGLWILPDVDPVAPGTYVVLADGGPLGAIGYRTVIERCGADVPSTCDVLAQDCGVEGYGCYSPEAPYCAPSGGLAVGEPCTGLASECAPGATCEQSVIDFDLWLCTPYCDANNTASAKACATLCPGNEIEIYDAQSLEPVGAFCNAGAGGGCEPLQPSCAAGQSCYGFDPPACDAAGTLANGAECIEGLTENCAPGNTCAGVQGSGIQYCVAYCDLDAAAGARACATLCPNRFWSYPTFGLCMPPA